MKDKSFREMYEEIKAKAKAMDILDLCRYIVLGLMYAMLLAYLVPMVLIHPLHYEWTKGYYTIGSAKFSFFDIYGFSAANTMWRLAIMYVLLLLVQKGKECKKNHTKLSAYFMQILRSFSVTDIFMLLYMVSLLISYAVSDFKETAYMGANGWFMGLMPHLLLVGSYFAISRLLPKNGGKWVMAAMIIVSVPVFFLGILNRYGIDPLGICVVGTSYISTVGNINWMCGYWAVVYPLCVGWYWILEKKPEEKKGLFMVKKVLLALAVVNGFASCVTQGSDSGVMSCGITVLLLGCLSVKKLNRLKSFLEILLLFCASILGLMVVQLFWPKQNNLQTALFGILVKTPLALVLGVVLLAVYLLLRQEKIQKKVQAIFAKAWKVLMGLLAVTIVSFIIALVANTTNPGCLGGLSDNPVFTFDREWGSKRGGTWTAGIKTWLSQDGLHKMFGVGPDCMADYIYSERDLDLVEGVRAQFGNSRLTNAHGEWITVLANLGVMGLIAFGGMMISGMVRFLKAGNSGEKAILLGAGCGLALFCYTINNTFSFQQIVCVIPLFIVLALGESFLRQHKAEKEKGKLEVDK